MVKLSETAPPKKNISKMFTILILTLLYTRFLAYLATLVWSFLNLLVVMTGCVDLVTRLLAPAPAQAAAPARQAPDPAPPARRPRRHNNQLKATRKTKEVHTITTFEEIVVQLPE